MIRVVNRGCRMSLSMAHVAQTRVPKCGALLLRQEEQGEGRTTLLPCRVFCCFFCCWTPLHRRRLLSSNQINTGGPFRPPAVLPAYSARERCATRRLTRTDHSTRSQAPTAPRITASPGRRLMKLSTCHAMILFRRSLSSCCKPRGAITTHLGPTLIPAHDVPAEPQRLDAHLDDRPVERQLQCFPCSMPGTRARGREHINFNLL